MAKKEIDIMQAFDRSFARYTVEELVGVICELQEELLDKRTGYEMHHQAWRYSKLHDAVDKMGGFANFKHWVINKAANCKKSWDALENKITELENQVETLAHSPCENQHLCVEGMDEWKHRAQLAEREVSRLKGIIDDMYRTLKEAK